MHTYTITLLIETDKDDLGDLLDGVTDAIDNRYPLPFALDEGAEADGTAVTIERGHKDDADRHLCFLRAMLDALETDAVQALDKIREQPLYATERIASTAYNSVNHAAHTMRAYLAYDVKPTEP